MFNRQQNLNHPFVKSNLMNGGILNLQLEGPATLLSLLNEEDTSWWGWPWWQGFLCQFRFGVFGKWDQSYNEWRGISFFKNCFICPNIITRLHLHSHQRQFCCALAKVWKNCSFTPNKRGNVLQNPCCLLTHPQKRSNTFRLKMRVLEQHQNHHRTINSQRSFISILTQVYYC